MRAVWHGRPVAVVGGGPAGCAAAKAVAESGLPVLVFERGLPGRDKACGDALVPEAIRQLTKCGVDNACLPSLNGRPFESIELYGEAGMLWRFEQPEGPGWVVPRARLDQALRDALPALATVAYGTAVTDVNKQPNDTLQVLTRTSENILDEVQCAALIVANGAGSRIAARYGIAGQPNMSLSVTTYRTLSQARGLAFQFGHLYRPGYRWIFPGQNGIANVGFCAFPSGARRNLKVLAAGPDAAVLHGCRWRGGRGPLWSGRGCAWHAGSALVSCGDAAGLVNPYSGEGITAALLSGWEAGTAVASFLHGKGKRALEEYSVWVENAFRRRYNITTATGIWNVLCGTTACQSR
jgi:flavin-dependent dehydrogenase